MSDVFERLKCGSAAHKVKVNSDGSFTLEPLADKEFVEGILDLKPRKHYKRQAKANSRS